MRHRAEKLRGKLEITSAPGQGARVHFSVNLFDG
jgi:signal transduction histidine kinase